MSLESVVFRFLCCFVAHKVISPVTTLCHTTSDGDVMGTGLIFPAAPHPSLQSPYYEMWDGKLNRSGLKLDGLVSSPYTPVVGAGAATSSLRPPFHTSCGGRSKWFCLATPICAPVQLAHSIPPRLTVEYVKRSFWNAAVAVTVAVVGPLVGSATEAHSHVSHPPLLLHTAACCRASSAKPQQSIHHLQNRLLQYAVNASGCIHRA